MAAIGDPLESEQPKSLTTFVTWRWLAIVLFLMIALPVGILIANKSRGSEVDRGTVALIEAFSKRRLIEPRLSGGFKAGVFTAAGGDASVIGGTNLDQARDNLQDAAAKEMPNAQLAYARLLLSSGDNPRGAIKYLKVALANAPESADVHNDMGVCLIQQGRIEEAIDEFGRSLEKNPDMPEALFNRGLCYERLILRDAAAGEYQRLLNLERDPRWASEIKERYDKVSALIEPSQSAKEVVAAFRRLLGNGENEAAKRIADQNFEIIWKYAANEIQYRYLDQSAAGERQEAERALNELQFIGRAFLEEKGDQGIADLADYLHKLPASERLGLRDLLREYLTSVTMASHRKYSDAWARFDRHSIEFARRGNHLLQIFSLFYASSCLYGSGQLSASVEKLQEALLELENHKWPYVKAQLLSQLGVGYSRLGQDSLAIGYCKQALERDSGMPLLAAKSLQYLGNSYWHLGDLDNGADCLHKSTRLLLESLPTPDELAYNYLQLADIYRLRANHSLALINAKQALTFLNQVNDYNRAAQVSSFVAVEHARQGEADQADREAGQAFDYLQKLSPDQRAFTEPLVLMRSGAIASLRGDFERSLEYYRKAEELVPRSEEKKLPLLKVLLGRSEAYSHAREFGRARSDLERAVGEIEGYRAGLANIGDRRSFLDASLDVFDQLISLNLDVFDRQAEAFNLSEKSRARALLDELSPKSLVHSKQQTNGARYDRQVTPLDLKQVADALPEDLRLLIYTVTDQHTYLFLVTHTGLDVARSDATSEQLGRLVTDCTAGLKNKTSPIAELSEKLRDLYRSLIEPIEQKIGDGKTLCIVPDKALHFVPFAALIDGSGRYLIESQQLTYAPSASALVQCLREKRAKVRTGDEAILAVGNPKFKRDAFPYLDNLPDAEREATEAASFYKRSVLLIGPQATEQEVRRGLKSCDVAHLALHCLVDEKALVLAGPTASIGGDASAPSSTESTADDGLLYLSEIYGISLPQTRLVVLSACQSGLGQYYRGEGIVSLARPFLALKVPTVVTSLWSVDSEATAELMIEFHRERQLKSRGVGDSLRAAQIKMAHSAHYEHPYYWAPFITVGAN